MSMRSSVLLQVYLCLSFSSWAATPRKVDASIVSITGVNILERAREVNQGVYSNLQSFVCHEQVDRFIGSLSGQSARTLDTVTANLSFERGVEQYSDVHQNSLVRPNFSSLTGAWSEGEYGTLLLQTEQLLSTQKVEFEIFAKLKGEPAAIFSFEVNSDDSPWDLTVGARHYRLAFTTDVWISVRSGEILKIERTSQVLPPESHISEIQWGITLDRVILNDKPWLLPISGTYAVYYNESRRREWNLINFSNYQRYGAQTAFKFN